MNKRFSKVILIILILAAPAVRAQYYDIGQAPASTRWMKIDTTDFSIIYPDYLFEKAREAAIIFSRQAESVAAGMQVKPRKTPVVLHPSSAVSNAYAIWAPRRLELLTTPPQDTYAQPWLHQLALHEYRHIVQLSKLDQGITRALGYLFGQQAAAVSTGLFIPSWFIEGDAVAIETALSRSGRGRLPSFNAPLRAQLAEKGPYSYPKASLGSYRDFVPDVYTMGYHIIAASRAIYGVSPWNSAMNTVARKPWTLAPFNKGLKNETGLNKKGIYLQSMAYLDSLWSGIRHGDTADRIVTLNAKSHTNYHNPCRLNDTTIVTLKTTLHDIPRIVKVYHCGKEEIIHTPGYIPDNRISCSGGVIVWPEYRPHVRWATVSYTDLVYLNAITGETIRKTFRKRLFAPALSPDGEMTAVVETAQTGQYYITVIHNDTLTRYPSPKGVFPSHPSWPEDQKRIVFTGTSDAGKALFLLNLEDGSCDQLLPYAYEEISEPSFCKQDIIFTASVDAISQICRLNLETGQTELLTASAYGAHAPSCLKNTLTYLEYTADGTRIAFRQLSETSSPLNMSENDHSWPLATTLSLQESFSKENPGQPDNNITGKKYSKAAHLFGIHSWAPLYIDIGGETARPGISVMSQNLLSTMFITAGYDYNIAEDAGLFRAGLTWKGWFPELRATTSHGLRASTFSDTTGQIRRFTWNETNLDFSISQSLDLSKGRYSRGIYGEIGHQFRQVQHNSSTPDRFTRGILSGLRYRFFGYSYMRQSFRDLAPRLGINFEASFQHTPFGETDAGKIYAIQGQVFLPGLAANHSLSFYSGIQHSERGDYRYSDIINISRGYTSIPYGNRLSSWKAAYRLPLFYPDYHLGGIVYIKRLRANTFYDFLKVKDEISRYFNSAGADVVADFHIFGLSTPVSAGLRTVYTFRKGEIVPGFLLSVNFYEY